jgi:hypothetical protein
VCSSPDHPLFPCSEKGETSEFTMLALLKKENLMRHPLCFFYHVTHCVCTMKKQGRHEHEARHVLVGARRKKMLKLAKSSQNAWQMSLPLTIG